VIKLKLLKLNGRFQRLCAVSLGSLLLTTLFLPVLAQTGTAVVRVEPAVLEIGDGQVETVQIVLENAVEVYGIEVRASFDPAVVEVVDSNPDTPGVQLIPGPFIQPDFLVRNEADNVEGTLQYVATQVNPTEPVTGTGVVFSIMLRGKGQGSQATVMIDFEDIVDRRGVKLEVQGEGGIVQIVRPKSPTPTPETTLQEPVSGNAPPALPEDSTAEDNLNAPYMLLGTGEPTPMPDQQYQSPTAMRVKTDEKLLILIGLSGLIGAFVVFTLATSFLLSKKK
jgi:hypothetical protein